VTFSPASFFIRHWQFTLVVFALLGLLGLNAFATIPREEDPRFPIPVVVVRAVLPGASPADMEELVVKPVELAVSGLDNVRSVASSSSDGAAYVTASFTWDVDARRKYDEVVRQIDALKATLPATATVKVERRQTSEVAIFEVALVSNTLPMRRFEQLARQLRDEINRTPGVRDTTVWGAPPVEVRVSVDPGRLAALRLPIETVTAALIAASAEGPVGVVEAHGREFDLKLRGAFRSLEQVAATAIIRPDGRIVRLSEVAEVKWATAPPQHLTRFNGQRALPVTGTKTDAADLLSVTRATREKMETFRRHLPLGVELKSGFFQSDNVAHRLERLKRDFMLALVIVLITLLPLGIRAAAVVAISIPMSLLIGLAGVQALGVSLNQLTIAGFALTLGLLVDDSIVVTENIARHLRSGLSRTEAAIRGSGQIALAVLGCTATLMLAFLPLMALPGGSGAFIRALPLTVLCTISASLLVSLTLVPFLASRWLPADPVPDGGPLLRGVNGAIHRLYRPLLQQALARPRFALVLLLGICALSAPILRVIGTSLFPRADTPQFLIDIEAPQGANLQVTDEALRFVESRLSGLPDVAWFASNLGRGNPQIYYNIDQHGPSGGFAEVFVAARSGRDSAPLAEHLRELTAGYSGARISVKTFEVGPPCKRR
jgi:multidrug efflux pump subunit AcrB